MTDSSPMEPAVADAELQLANELRRIVNRLVLVRPSEQELLQVTEQARALADRLDGLDGLPAGVGASEASGARAGELTPYSPWSGQNNVLAPPVELWHVPGEDFGPRGRRTEGRVLFGAAYEGPAGRVHGGCLAGVFDELLGHAQRSAGFTGRLSLDFRRPTPLHRQIDLRAWVERIEGRKRWVRGVAELDGLLLVEAEGLFIARREGIADAETGAVGGS